MNLESELPICRSAPATHAVRTPWPWAMFLSAAVLAMKAPDAFRLPQFWAEDGTIFFAQQWHHAIPQLFVPYGGYLNALQRLIAWMATALPVVHAPAIFVLFATLIGAAAIASLRQLERIGIPFVLTLAVLGLTPTSGEVFGTLTNVHWLLQFYLIAFLVRFATDAATLSTTSDAIVMLAIALTGPMGIFAIAAAFGIAVLQYLLAQPGERRACSVLRSFGTAGAAALLVGAMVQATTLALKAPAQTHDLSLHRLPGILTVLGGLQNHILGAGVVPDRVFIGVFLALMVTTVLLQRRRVAALTAFLGIAMFVLFQLTAASLKLPNLLDFSLPLGFTDRYFVAAKMLFWWSLALTALALLPPRSAVGLTLAMLIVASVWTDAPLRRSALADLRWSHYAAKIESGAESVTVPINPVPWRFRVTGKQESGTTTRPDPETLR